MDASPTMVSRFNKLFPQMTAVCEPVETSPFFCRSFDGIIAIGLIFLLPADTQSYLISRVASALNPGGRFLFTSPPQMCKWIDLTTQYKSHSLGENTYTQLCSKEGLILDGKYMDEGENCYFHFLKP